MNNKRRIRFAMILLPVILLVITSLTRCSHEENHHNHIAADIEHESEALNHEHEISSNVGKGKAVIAADDEKGIQLSEKTVKAIGISVAPVSNLRVSGKNQYRVPVQALVYYEDKVGIYLKRNNWFAMVNAKLIKSERRFAVIRAPLIRRDDLMVITGTPLLRLAYLEAFGASGQGHCH